jgi:hypothetical protein
MLHLLYTFRSSYRCTQDSNLIKIWSHQTYFKLFQQRNEQHHHHEIMLKLKDLTLMSLVDGVDSELANDAPSSESRSIGYSLRSLHRRLRRVGVTQWRHYATALNWAITYQNDRVAYSKPTPTTKRLSTLNFRCWNLMGA